MVLALIRDGFGPHDLKVTITLVIWVTSPHSKKLLPSHTLLPFVHPAISQIKEQIKRFELKVLCKNTFFHLLISLWLAEFFTKVTKFPCSC
jgi:hypothetical protein